MWGRFPFDEHIFQMGWNHQPADDFAVWVLDEMTCCGCCFLLFSPAPGMGFMGICLGLVPKFINNNNNNNHNNHNNHNNSNNGSNNNNNNDAHKTRKGTQNTQTTHTQSRNKELEKKKHVKWTQFALEPVMSVFVGCNICYDIGWLEIFSDWVWHVKNSCFLNQAAEIWLSKEQFLFNTYWPPVYVYHVIQIFCY